MSEVKLNKNQIVALIFQSAERDFDNFDLSDCAEIRFGASAFDEYFHRYSEKEIQDWYYREYLPDRAEDIEEGFDRGQ